MKKNLLKIYLVALVMAVVFLPNLVLATDNTINALLGETAGSEGAGFDVENTSSTSLARTLGFLALGFMSFIGVIFICYTIYGGFIYMTAAGNEEKTSKAKNIIRDGAIGIIIILSAASIYYFVTSIVGDTAVGSPAFSS